ncbi:MAG: hypothetical protein ACTSQP_17175 [Promethearchaeota archaeon]
MNNIREASIYMLFIVGFFLLLFRDLEKLRWLGGRKDEEVPIKDGFYWLSLYFSLLFLYVIRFEMEYLFSLKFNDDYLIVYSNQIFGIGLLLFLIVILLLKGFINPTINFLIAFSVNIIITLMIWQYASYSYNFLLSPLPGMMSAIILEFILSKIYKKGNQELWRLKKVWKYINNKCFLLCFTILFAIEMFFQIHHVSLTTFWLYI